MSGPTVRDVVERLRANGFDEAFVSPYIAEENRRNPPPLLQITRSVSEFGRAMRKAFGPRYTDRHFYALAGPSVGGES